MDIFEFNNYKKYIQSWVKRQPGKGRGQWAEIARQCQVSTVLISQIFKGSKNLSLEQALKLSHYLGHLKAEREYFMTLVNLAKAGSKDLEQYYQEEVTTLKNQSLELKNRLKTHKQLSPTAQSTFYSNWIYSAIRILSGINEYNSVSKICKKLDLEENIVEEAVEFLLKEGLCVLKEGKLSSGPQGTHLAKESPLIKSRQISWRLKVIEKMDKKSENQLFFTAPMSLSKEDIPKVKKILLKTIDEIVEVVRNSPAEELVCFNIDLTEI